MEDKVPDLSCIKRNGVAAVIERMIKLEIKFLTDSGQNYSIIKGYGTMLNAFDKIFYLRLRRQHL